jgi:predicted RNA-binding protein
MKYWLATGTHFNSNVAIKKKIWGAQKMFASSIKKVNIGDILIIFARRENDRPAAITCTFEITSTLYVDNEPIFKSHSPLFTEIYPIRIKLKLIRVFANPVDIKSMVPYLDIFSNKKYWSCHLSGRAISEISKKDFQKINEMNS